MTLADKARQAAEGDPMTMQDLAKEYAALVPEWAQPGMRCVDPETGDIWRRVEHVWVRNNPGTMLWLGADYYLAADCELAASGNFQSLMRAIAAGPDLDDKATLGALLLGLDVLRVSQSSLGDVGFQATGVLCAIPADDWRHRVTSAEAIIRACIAQAKEQP